MLNLDIERRESLPGQMPLFDELPRHSREVVIEVSGGVATVLHAPRGVEVRIIDRDERKHA